MERLPHIDEHAVSVHASRERVWTALADVLRGVGEASPLAHVLGCDPVRGTPGFAGAVGDALPGFRVVSAEPGRTLALEGRHRFSRYRLTFLLGDDGRLRARTDAAFPGPHGRVYRAAVIGTGAHRVVTQLILRRVARRAVA